MTANDLTWHETVAQADLDDEEPTQVKIGEIIIAICKLDDGIYAIDDICTHEHAYLSDGFMEDGCVECPLHQALFDIKTGKAMSAPAMVDLKTYATKIDQGMVFVGIN